MDKIRAIKFFVRVADLGSFTNVAEEFGLVKSMISKEVSKLEDDVGARLLQRSTRKISLTPIGEEYLKRCREILKKIEDADAFVQESQSIPKGKLKINASMAMGCTFLGEALADFMCLYPEIELDVHLDDEPLDLIEHGFDLGFRAASRLFDSNYIGKVLTRFSYKICASPAYLEKHGEILEVEQLSEHNCFVYSYFRGKNVWPLGEGIAVQGNVKANSAVFLMQMIKKGLGISFSPDFICDEALRAGEVVEILKDHKRPELTLFALYPAREFVPPRLIECVKFLEEWFKKH